MPKSRVIFQVIFISVLGLLFSPGPVSGEQAEKAEKIRIAVLNLKMERGLDQGLVKLLNELLLTEFQRSGKYEVIGGSDIEGMLKLEEQKQVLNCTDASCLAEIGGALGVQKLAIGSIGKVGSLYLVNVKIINIMNAKVEGRVSYEVEGIEDKLVRAITHSVRELVTGKRPEGAEAGFGRPGVSGGIEQTRQEYNLWGHVTLWSGVGCAAFGFASMFLAMDAGDRYDHTGDPDDLDDTRTWSGVMWTGFALGAALAATGVTLWLLEPEEDGGGTQAAASLGPSLDGQGLVFTVTGSW